MDAFGVCAMKCSDDEEKALPSLGFKEILHISVDTALADTPHQFRGPGPRYCFIFMLGLQVMM